MLRADRRLKLSCRQPGMWRSKRSRPEWLARPGGGVDPVGDGVDGVAGKQEPGDLAVSLGHPVDVAAEVQRQEGHVERGAALGHLREVVEVFGMMEDAADELHAEGVVHIEEVETWAQDLIHHVDRELVVPGRDRRMSGEDTMPSHGLDVGAGD